MTFSREYDELRRHIDALSRLVDLSGKLVVPDIIEFVISDRYLNRTLHPRQGTVLKTMTLQDELFTNYDDHVIDEWINSYLLSADETGEGNHGIVPDVRERIAINKAKGRSAFRETVAVIGRRGGKGFLGSVFASYQTFRLLAKDSPQKRYGIDRDKRIRGLVFAGNLAQAKENQWVEIANFMCDATCFAPFIADRLSASLLLYTPADLRRLHEAGPDAARRPLDYASIEWVAKEATAIAGRGVSSFMQIFDEMSHTLATGANRSAEEIYDAATPALDEFKEDGVTYASSSPYHRLGKFHELYQLSRERDENGPVYPERLMYQLESWDPYVDWERAPHIEAKPWQGRKRMYFKKLVGAPQEYDEQMRQLERANPEGFGVERRGHFAFAFNAFLKESVIARMWEPWPTPDKPIMQRTMGMLAITYRAHGDPSRTNSKYGFAIAHAEPADERGLPHVMIDLVTHWDPADFPDHEIDHAYVMNEIRAYIDDFLPATISFDQYDLLPTIQPLRKHVMTRNYPKPVHVVPRNATAELNTKTYTVLKYALGLGLVHAPRYEQLEIELKSLQETNGKIHAPTYGFVKSKDVADCLAALVHDLIGDKISAFVNGTLSIPLRASHPGGISDNDPAQLFDGLRRRTNWHGAQRGGRRPGRHRGR